MLFVNLQHTWWQLRVHACPSCETDGLAQLFLMANVRGGQEDGVSVSVCVCVCVQGIAQPERIIYVGKNLLDHRVQPLPQHCPAHQQQLLVSSIRDAASEMLLLPLGEVTPCSADGRNVVPACMNRWSESTT